MSTSSISGAPEAFIKGRAAALGFDACGIAAAGNVDPDNHLKNWLARGFHADMAWMAGTADIRVDIRLKLPDAQSVVVVARNYYVERPGWTEAVKHDAHGPMGESLPSSAVGRVSRYAWGRDYHRVLAKPLKALAGEIHTLALEGVPLGSAAPHVPYLSIDSGPVLERAYAARAGIGWIGKNGLLLNERLGSWFFLGVIVTSLKLVPDAPVANRCGACTRCIEACPTGAIVEPGVVDAGRCISYHNKRQGEIPPEVQSRMGGWLFGCDICQEACPCNHTVRATTEPDFLPRPGLANPCLEEWLSMDEPVFDHVTAGTPVHRIGHKGMRRNLRIAVRNLCSLD